ncbi:DUF4350 domain-containing protein [Streptomyces solincola]|uniref:DUF4350 domain-containing protein n=1 Tax=Streptomyces solincola TaxID=2100817 RepID=A0A2S9PYX3_9ACTN|nr:DUF4350 domain-containing protein [Streptomyces solincola]PRH79598.1 DUF4350 domain-containing protein [Streptomyces solincola]
MTTVPVATSTAPGARQMWARLRGLLLVAALVLLAAAVMALLRSDEQHGSLDPRSADPDGSRATAELLTQRGVDLRVATRLDDALSAGGPDTTLLVTDPDLLTDRQRTRLRDERDTTGGRLVLLDAGPAATRALAPGVRAESTRAPLTALQPSCDLAAAQRAGNADLGGRLYTSSADSSHLCYRSDGAAALVRTDSPANGETVLLGSGDLLHNERLDEQGNASLALQLLGSRSHLIWYLPSSGDPTATGVHDDDGSASFFDLIPSGWLWATLQLALAAVLAAIWRARRLGPLVTERLPAVVHASESTEGRARLYRTTNARAQAAAVLREASRSRLAPLVGVPASQAHDPGILLPAVSTRLSSPGPASPANPPDPSELLFGRAPADDAALVLLADQLDALEREVRTS